MLKTKKKTLYWIGIILGLTAITVVILVGLHARKSAAGAALREPSAADAASEESHGLIQTVETVSFETIRDGLQEMNYLVTEEYSFTEVISDSKVIKFLIELSPTKSSYVASYDGTVEAGVDFSAASVETEQRDGKTHVTVTLPKATIHQTAIDHDSFVLYSEKDGIGTSFSVEDFNDRLKELEQNAEEKALQKGVLEKAEKNAEQVITGLVSSLMTDTDYSLEIRFQ